MESKIIRTGPQTQQLPRDFNTPFPFCINCHKFMHHVWYLSCFPLWNRKGNKLKVLSFMSACLMSYISSIEKSSQADKDIYRFTPGGVSKLTLNNSRFSLDYLGSGHALLPLIGHQMRGFGCQNSGKNLKYKWLMIRDRDLVCGTQWYTDYMTKISVNRPRKAT